MWCPNCQADVAAEVSAETERVRCATCSTEIQAGTHVRTGAKTEAARELLRRWANDDLFDPFGPLPGIAERPASAMDTVELTGKTTVEIPVAAASSQETSRRAAEVPPATSGPRPFLRVDRSHSSTVSVATEPPAVEPTIPAEELQQEPAPAVHRVHQAHSPVTAGPRITIAQSAPVAADSGEDVRAAIDEDLARQGSWTTFWGQILAYLGVAGLTVGTSLVLWGYFGGPVNYTPTGWLILTAGQMLLFLGVITLVSGGMEQTTEEVARRVDRLGSRLIRIEQATRANSVRGPHSPAGHYADSPAASQQSTQRERQSA